MSLRRPSLLASLHAFAFSSIVLRPSSSASPPSRRPRPGYMPAPQPSSTISTLYHHHHHLQYRHTLRPLRFPITPAFALALASPLCPPSPSLCMVCHPSASPSDDPPVPARRPATRSSLPSTSFPPSSPDPPVSAAAHALHFLLSHSTSTTTTTSTSSMSVSDSSASSVDDPSTPSSSDSHEHGSPSPSQTPALSAAAVAAAAGLAAGLSARADSDAALSTSTITSTDSDHSSPPASPPARHRLCFRPGVVCIPHPEKADKGGEDAYFIQAHALGVFDGVGGWSSIGIDPGLYSKQLAHLTSTYIARDGPASATDALRTATDNNRAIGSSTACVVGLDAERLVGVNLGDSGLLVIRRGAVVYRTSEQQHYFNCPYQIGTDSLDTVDVGAPIDFSLQDGDCLVMGTDGLWDNVFTDRIVEIVSQHYAPATMETEACLEEMMPGVQDDCENGSGVDIQDGQQNAVKQSRSESRDSKTTSDGSSMVSELSTRPRSNDDGNVTMESSCAEDANVAQTIAQALADAAVKVANDERGSSPFAVNACNAGHMFLGGKVDDITIISAIVMDAERSKSEGVQCDMEVVGPGREDGVRVKLDLGTD